MRTEQIAQTGVLVRSRGSWHEQTAPGPTSRTRNETSEGTGPSSGSRRLHGHKEEVSSTTHYQPTAPEKPSVGFLEDDFLDRLTDWAILPEPVRSFGHSQPLLAQTLAVRTLAVSLANVSREKCLRMSIHDEEAS